MQQADFTLFGQSRLTKIAGMSSQESNGVYDNVYSHTQSYMFIYSATFLKIHIYIMNVDTLTIALVLIINYQNALLE